jgi:hypothetical protein
MKTHRCLPTSNRRLIAYQTKEIQIEAELDKFGDHMPSTTQHRGGFSFPSESSSFSSILSYIWPALSLTRTSGFHAQTGDLMPVVSFSDCRISLLRKEISIF